MNLGIPNTKIYAEVLEQDAINQFREAMNLDCNIQGALMPDSHTGYTLPIGTVIKSKGRIFPSYVGYDIGCGMSAIKLDVDYKQLDLNKLKDDIVEKIPVGSAKHTKPQKYNLGECTNIAKQAFETAKYQLGTLGGGNHFIELGTGRDSKLWIVIHSGSRGFGYKIAEHYMKLSAITNTDEQRYIDEFKAKNTWREHNPEKYDKALEEFVYRRVRARLKTNLEGHYSFDINSDNGKNYLKDLNVGLEFALENRKRMGEVIKGLINKQLKESVKELMFINRNHNHAEVFDDFVIHRKGATQADKGMYGVIPGNMRDGSFIIKGKGDVDSMCSSSHGAGRVLSRAKAKTELDVEEFHNDMKGIVSNHSDNTIDESPKAYKNIFEVMELQKDLVEVVDHIKPILNIKG